MLSTDELNNGMTFILQLLNVAGERVQWIETLRGDTAKRWYDIHRQSNWTALQAEAADVFHRRVTEAEAKSIRTARYRCVVIDTLAVNADELAPGRGSL